jgi:hypothetical protein
MLQKDTVACKLATAHYEMPMTGKGEAYGSAARGINSIQSLGGIFSLGL